ncbi:matrix-remodeling-associated protein 7 isoform X1 [Malaclemys terrapin pileata]|uniref:matrix-remodeling-associated protein 7 isoform X1 n=1 Tax=Malaclemys terrapin pileata TaxID=2991368 RepID=UPI0023A7E790|nr:matrix-remodeling-associated protein 7 isoform X1 [Malaclemys terrapin pileata]
MDVAVDLYLAVPLLFTVLAVILASVFVKLRTTEGDKAAETAKGEGSQGKEATEQGEERKDGEGEGKEGEALKEEGIPRGEKDEEGAKDEGRRIPVEEIGVEEGKAKRAEENEEQQTKEEAVAVAAAARTAKADKQSHPQEMNIPRQAAEVVEEEEEEEEDDDDESKEEDQDWEKERLVVNEPDLDDAADEKISFKYSPGKLRGNQYKTMMTKEELEEEQRVQREQLTAIFRLMKENSETFGEMSEGDMKEQLKLYDM